jgi:hypothetical protein
MKKRRDDSGEIKTLTIRSSPKVVAPIIALLVFLFPPQVFGQLLREPQTPYHFLRYDDAPSDQQSPAWSNDFWAPIKFIPLGILPGSHINFGGPFPTLETERQRKNGDGTRSAEVWELLGQAASAERSNLSICEKVLPQDGSLDALRACS